MSVADLISDMVRAGVPAELIGRTAALLAEREAVAVKVVDEQAERRRAADRERKAVLRNSAEVSGTAQVDLSPQKKVSPDPSKKTTPSLSEAALPRTERKHAWPDDFCEQVWSIFPKHVEKKAGMDALKAVHRADKLDWQTLTAAIASLAATCEPQFVPALHRWLKGERWTDQRPVAKPGAGPPQRRTFGQLVAESAAEAAGYPHDHSHHQADDHRGPTLDLEPGGTGADLVDLQSHRAGRGAW